MQQTSLALSVLLTAAACDSYEPLEPSTPTPSVASATQSEPVKPTADGVVTDQGAAETAEEEAPADAPVEPSNAAFISVRGKGLVVLTDDGFSVVPGSNAVYINGFVHGADGSLYALGSTAVYSVKTSGLSEVARVDFDVVGVVADFDVDAEGTIWMIGGKGVGHYTDGAWTMETFADLGLSKDDNRAGIAVDKEGDPWAATEKGLVHRSGGAWVEANMPKGKTRWLDDVNRGVDGEIYVSTYDRLFRLTGTPARVKIKTEAYGNAGDVTFAQSTYGVAQSGIESVSVFVPTDKAKRYGKKDLGVGTVSTATVDGRGRVWAAGDAGIAIVGPGDERVTWRSGSVEEVAGQVSNIVVRGEGPRLPEAGAIKRGGLRGRITKDDKGAAGLKIELCESPDFVYSRTPCSGAPTHLRGKTDADGNFSFEDVPLGAYGIAIKSGRKWQVTMGAALGTNMTAGQSNDLGTFKLE